MGAYTPVPFIKRGLISRIEKKLIAPTIKALAKEDALYKGFLYPGLILTRKGPMVLEFNCRLGDPETQPLMFQLKSDIVDIFEAIADNKVGKAEFQWFKGSSVCVVLASAGYPGEYKKGNEIFGLKKISHKNDIIAFHSGTKLYGEKVVSYGGRVLGICARDSNLKGALKKAYNAIGRNGIYFEGMQYRKDIGKKGLKN